MTGISQKTCRVTEIVVEPAGLWVSDVSFFAQACLSCFVPAFISPLHDQDKNPTGEDKKPIGMCLSDFPMFTNYGTPTAMTFGCGRFFDMEGGAHQFDEYIECDKLVEFTKIIALFLLNYKF